MGDLEVEADGHHEVEDDLAASEAEVREGEGQGISFVICPAFVSFFLQHSIYTPLVEFFYRVFGFAGIIDINLSLDLLL